MEMDAIDRADEHAAAAREILAVGPFESAEVSAPALAYASVHALLAIEARLDAMLIAWVDK